MNSEPDSIEPTIIPLFKLNKDENSKGYLLNKIESVHKLVGKPPENTWLYVMATEDNAYDQVEFAYIVDNTTIKEYLTKVKEILSNAKPV